MAKNIFISVLTKVRYREKSQTISGAAEIKCKISLKKLASKNIKMKSYYKSLSLCWKYRRLFIVFPKFATEKHHLRRHKKVDYSSWETSFSHTLAHCETTLNFSTNWWLIKKSQDPSILSSGWPCGCGRVRATPGHSPKCWEHWQPPQGVCHWAGGGGRAGKGSESSSGRRPHTLEHLQARRLRSAWHTTQFWAPNPQPPTQDQQTCWLCQGSVKGKWREMSL